MFACACSHIITLMLPKLTADITLAESLLACFMAFRALLVGTVRQGEITVLSVYYRPR